MSGVFPLQSTVSQAQGPARVNTPEHYGRSPQTEQPGQQCKLLRHHLRMSFVLLIAAIAALMLVLAMAFGGIAGCASTTLHTPIGDYTSTKDANLDHLIITIEKTPDGGEITHVEVGGASGAASPVIAAQGAIIKAAIEAGMAAGAKAVVPIP